MTATRLGTQANLTRFPRSAQTVTISARGVQMTFRSGMQQFQALRDINLEVQQGEVQLLMGPSGSGKTTLLSILGGILTPTGGKVCLLGQDLTRMSRSQLSKFRLQHIGFVFQEGTSKNCLIANEQKLKVLLYRSYSQ